MSRLTSKRAPRRSQRVRNETLSSFPTRPKPEQSCRVYQVCTGGSRSSSPHRAERQERSLGLEKWFPHPWSAAPARAESCLDFSCLNHVRACTCSCIDATRFKSVVHQRRGSLGRVLARTYGLHLACEGLARTGPMRGSLRPDGANSGLRILAATGLPASGLVFPCSEILPRRS
jgi:hypothetical protein